MDKLTIITLNARGLNGIEKQNMSINAMLCMKCDIILLQDTRLSDDKWTMLSRKLRPHYVVSWSVWEMSPTRGRGCAILIAAERGLEVMSTEKDNTGRWIYVDVQFQNQYFRVINIYASCLATERRSLIRSIEPMVNVKYDVIIGGDFNMVENKEMDRSGTTNSVGDVSALKDIVSRYNLVDIWRAKHPGLKEYTFHSTKAHSRLDRFYISSSLQARANSCIIIPWPLSDHSIVELELEFELSIWTLDQRIMKHPEFRKAIEQICAKPSSLPEEKWWEDFKDQVRSTAILISRGQSETIRMEYITAAKPLAEAFRLESERPGTKAKEVVDAKSELKMYIQRFLSDTNGHSGAGNIGESGRLKTNGEKNIIQLNMQKGNSKNTRNTKSDNHSTDESKQILNDIIFDGVNNAKEDRYLRTIKNNLYLNHHTDDVKSQSKVTKSKPLIGLTVSQCSKPGYKGGVASHSNGCTSEKNRSTKNINLYNECRKAFRTLRLTPGPDGLSLEFYELFFDLFEDHFISLLSLYQNEGTVSDEEISIDGITSLKAVSSGKKQQGDRLKLCTQNIDYKVIASIASPKKNCR